MRYNHTVMLAAALLVGAAAMTGCAAQTGTEAGRTSQPAQQQTAQPASDPSAPDHSDDGEQTSPEASPEATEEPEQSEQLALTVDGKETKASALIESGALLLPLQATGEALGWKAESKATEEETQTKHEIALQKDDSRITVSYEVSDNTIRRISWQKDGLLIPVDARIETRNDVVYVPAAFYEEAMDVKVTKKGNSVEVSSPEPMDTPQTNQ